MPNTAWLALFSLTLTGGQLLFKRAAQSIVGLPPSKLVAVLAGNGWLWTALALYGFSTLLWVWILARVPLSQAYPWTALGAVVVPLAAVALFGEAVKPVFWLGAIMIGAGVMLTQMGAGR